MALDRHQRPGLYRLERPAIPTILPDETAFPRLWGMCRTFPAWMWC